MVIEILQTVGLAIRGEEFEIGSEGSKFKGKCHNPDRESGLPDLAILILLGSRHPSTYFVSLLLSGFPFDPRIFRDFSRFLKSFGKGCVQFTDSPEIGWWNPNSAACSITR